MRQGKLSNETLQTILFSKIDSFRSEVVAGAGVGEDCAALDLGGGLCVLTTDPITIASNDMGSLAVHISVNDLASAGAEPVALLATFLIPPDVKESVLEEAIDQLLDTAKSLNVSLVGGHTEVTDAVNKIIISITAVGKAAKGQFLKTGGMQEGDTLIMTKYAGIEGTCILYKDCYEKLKPILDERDITEITGMEGKISVLKEGILASRMGAVAMHDATEGGVLGAVYEMCHSANVGAIVDVNAIPVMKSTEKICKFFGIDPLRMIASGCMLIAVRKNADALLEALRKENIPATVIAAITGTALCTKDGSPIEAQERDALYDALE